MGIRETKQAKIWVRVREGKTPEEAATERRNKVLKRINSAGYSREDVPLRNVRSTWGW